MNHCSNVRKTLRVAACSEKPSEFKLRDFLVLAYFHYIIKSPKRTCCKFHLSESSPKQCPNKNKKKNRTDVVPALPESWYSNKETSDKAAQLLRLLVSSKASQTIWGGKGMFQPQLRSNHTIYWCIGKSSYNEKKHHDTRLRNWYNQSKWKFLFRCFRSVYEKYKPTHIAIFRGTYGPGGSTCCKGVMDGLWMKPIMRWRE